MPPSPKRKSSKKSIANRTPPITPKKSAPPKKRSSLMRDLSVAVALIAAVVAAAAGYYWKEGSVALMQPASKWSQLSQIQKEISHTAKSQKSAPEENKTAQPKEKKVEHKSDIAVRIDKQRETAMRASYSEPPKQTPPPVSVADIKQGKRPKLVIIIDDVAHPSQLQQILSIPLKLTPSIFPPSALSKDGSKMAKGFKHAMIHLPLEAADYPKNAMPGTITLRDSKEKMEARVKDLRTWFPNVIYVNNHTGSVFTENFEKMKILYGLLKKERFIFVDSRTTPKTQGAKVARVYNDSYLHRDVFIDNRQQFGAIREQLKEAIKIAQKNGYAIAIGHPYPITIRSLRNSLDILVDADVVYMDELMK